MKQDEKRQAKLSERARRKIRDYYLNNAVSVRAVASEFGVSPSSVWRAITLA